jgi:primosomal protein N' (replication factor Y)
VWLQTHHPDHPLLNTLINGGYHAFAEGELEQRQAAGFPPFAHLALLRAEAKQVDAANAFLHATKSAFTNSMRDAARLEPGTSRCDQQSALEIQGPLPAPMSRRAGMHRTQLLLSSPSRRALHALLDTALPAIHDLPEARKVRWSLDVDPLDLY